MTRMILAATLILTGCSKEPIDNDFGELSAPEEPVEVADAEEADDEPEMQPVAKRGGNVFMRNQAPLVEKSAAMAENPNLIETVNTSSSSNYLVAVKDSGFAGVSRTQIAILNREVETLRAVNGDYPDFETFKAYLDNAGMQYAGLKPYQMYAYDEPKHTVVLLEDTELRKQILGQ